MLENKHRRARGAHPSPRHRLAGAKPHEIVGNAPSSFTVIPKQLSMWLNDVDGDCCTAEEAFAKACSNPEIFIADATVQTWANANGFLNGADLISVLDAMQSAGFVQDGTVYCDGSPTSVDWTNAAQLRDAIFNNCPVKIGVAGDQLENVVGGTNGWFATGLAIDGNEDHCVSLCGYGTINELATALGVTVPAGVDGTKPGYLLFTWDTIGIIDVPSLLAITAEAWVRNPTTIVGGPTPPVPVPTPTPTPCPTITEQVIITDVNNVSGIFTLPIVMDTTSASKRFFASVRVE
jgi:hypothetical protein